MNVYACGDMALHTIMGQILTSFWWLPFAAPLHGTAPNITVNCVQMTTKMILVCVYIFCDECIKERLASVLNILSNKVTVHVKRMGMTIFLFHVS